MPQKEIKESSQRERQIFTSINSKRGDESDQEEKKSEIYDFIYITVYKQIRVYYILYSLF